MVSRGFGSTQALATIEFVETVLPSAGPRPAVVSEGSQESEALRGWVIFVGPRVQLSGIEFVRSHCFDAEFQSGCGHLGQGADLLQRSRGFRKA